MECKKALGMESAAQNVRGLQEGREASAASSGDVIKFTGAIQVVVNNEYRSAHTVGSLVITLPNAGSRM